MITKKEAREIAIKYLQSRNREYLEVEKEDTIGFNENNKVLYGEYKDEFKNVYVVEYVVQWGLEEKGMLIYIDSDNGEVLYSISPTSWIEELEDTGEE